MVGKKNQRKPTSNFKFYCKALRVGALFSIHNGWKEKRKWMDENWDKELRNTLNWNNSLAKCQILKGMLTGVHSIAACVSDVKYQNFSLPKAGLWGLLAQHSGTTPPALCTRHNTSMVHAMVSSVHIPSPSVRTMPNLLVVFSLYRYNPQAHGYQSCFHQEVYLGI